MFNIDTASVFYQRRSSFGRFSSERPITTAQLGQVLYATTALQGYRSDLSPDGTNTYLTRLVVYCNNVAGLNRGVYVYDATNHGLSTVIEADYTTYWQPNYFLHNYNLNETAVIVGIIAKTEAVIDLLGNRGLRVLHAEVGMMTQGLYLATAALGLGCGAVLGFNNININQLFSLGDSKERTLILVMIGGERRNPGHFISEIK
jgi:SagB-type dehydrogenase family enzyme